MTFAQYSKTVHRHVDGFFDKHERTRCDFAEGQIQRVAPGFHVIQIAPGPRLRNWTYVSVGAGFVAAEGRRRSEYIIVAQEKSARHVALLAMTAHYHLTGEALDVGHTFPLGEPWLPGSSLDQMLVSLPYPFGPELEIVKADGVHLDILWLLPITKAEREFKRATGAEELEEKFEAAKIRFWDPHRASVV